MRVKTWKIIDMGDVGEGSVDVELDCDCGNSAVIPVIGRPIAAISGGGIVFDPGPHAIPKKIQCRKCGRVKEAS